MVSNPPMTHGWSKDIHGHEWQYICMYIYIAIYIYMSTRVSNASEDWDEILNCKEHEVSQKPFLDIAKPFF